MKKEDFKKIRDIKNEIERLYKLLEYIDDYDKSCYVNKKIEELKKLRNCIIFKAKLSEELEKNKLK